MNNNIDIDAEIAQLRIAAIFMFLLTLGLIPKRMWRLSVILSYCRQTVGTPPEGQESGHRQLFDNMEEFEDFIKSVEARNNGEFPIVDNFLFSFLGRLIIWGAIAILVSKLLGFK